MNTLNTLNHGHSFLLFHQALHQQAQKQECDGLQEPSQSEEQKQHKRSASKLRSVRIN
jgi:hypothetical protein